MIDLDAPLALAFASGMVATVNPCGFAMLPAYLGYFLGLEGQDRDVQASVSRSLGVGLSVAAGFLVVFGLAGLAIYHLQASVYEWVPWATIVIGLALAVLGFAMLRGFEPVISLPKMQRGGRTTGGGSMVVFGISYAIASISCALPLFTSAVVGTFRRENVVSSAAVFVAYALGMTLVLLALTVSLGMARQGLLRRLRQALPYVNRVSGAIIVIAELLGHEGVEEDLELRSSFGLMAFHGGNLEEGTDVIAAAVAEQAGASLYAVRQPVGLRWHLPSVEIGPDDSDSLAAFVDHVDVAIAIHGYGRDGMWTSLLLGGRHRDLAAHVGTHLRAAMPGYEVVDDLEAIPNDLRGVHRANPVNLPRDGGVQLELPPRTRSRTVPMWRDLPDTQPVPHQQDLIAGLVTAVRSWNGATG